MCVDGMRGRHWEDYGEDSVVGQELGSLTVHGRLYPYAYIQCEKEIESSGGLLGHTACTYRLTAGHTATTESEHVRVTDRAKHPAQTVWSVSLYNCIAMAMQLDTDVSLYNCFGV